MNFGANKTPFEIIKEHRFRRKSVKIINDPDSKFNDYSISGIGVVN